ncbi:MAG: YkgJ family cysteine cluster protein [Candidatus Bathyarchaeia archaeon]
MGIFLLAKQEFLYPDNVRWHCKRCSRCCRDMDSQSRHILLLEKEAQRIAAITKMQEHQFSKPTVDNLYHYEVLKIKGKCLFLRGNSCSIYKYRPLVCRFYPFMMEHIGSSLVISLTAGNCPGVGSGSRLEDSYFKQLAWTALSRLRR